MLFPLYKVKDDWCECTSFRGIRLHSVVGKVYGKVLINRIRDGIGVICKEQYSFKRGRGCMNEVCEKYLLKEEKKYPGYFWT